MFRDLKEYQEIAKIYAEKVSKPENLDERVRGGGVQSAPTIKPATPPQKGFGGGVGNKTNRRGSGARNNRKKPEKKMSNIPVIDGPVNNPEYGTNMSRDEKILILQNQKLRNQIQNQRRCILLKRKIEQDLVTSMLIS